ncbi:SRPBCC family protein [Kutzneria buriramensis]|uniref:Polyketide cyclase/dehydrase/lipid transport protein n=1 Tax=Kutzneria buriramensis TaxID=1045776 RepID=A0A3E0H7D4_9PSEU|nr:SRPBCC family protein [Kutzneria buriramensis]REH39365.1 polyketide cyclase/dehydrase/lipid transport protein [Kutzneria buriramensis]
MTTIAKFIDVDVPVRTVYTQWTRFESFPAFMDGVEHVDQVDDTLVHWVTRIAGVEREFDVQIIAEHPDELVAWVAVDGVPHGGVVVFQPINQTVTRVTLVMRYGPGAAAGATGPVRIGGNLTRFKALIEQHGAEARGEAASPTGQINLDLPRQPVQPDPALGDMEGVAPANFSGLS